MSRKVTVKKENVKAVCSAADGFDTLVLESDAGCVTWTKEQLERLAESTQQHSE